MILSRTPYRISFFGGGTDYPAYFREHGGAVLGTTIDKHCYLSVRRLPPFFEHRHRVAYSQVELPTTVGEIQHPSVRESLRFLGIEEGLSITHDGDLPARSGMGSSSSFTVGLLNALLALNGRRFSKAQLCEAATAVEQDRIGENVGSQDQAFAAHGGLNRIDFPAAGGATRVRNLILPAGTRQALESHLLLCFTGLSREASKVAKEQIAAIPSKLAEMGRMKEMVDEGERILLRGPASVEDFGRLLHESWLLKRNLSSKITNERIDAAYEAARKAGALGGKLLGAGAGGFLLLFAPPDRAEAVRASLANLVHVPFRFEDAGSEILYHQSRDY